MSLFFSQIISIYSFFIMAISLVTILYNKNFIHKLIGLGIFQFSVLLYYIISAKVDNARIPILSCLDYNKCPDVYSNPLPHVLMLTAIVVGLSVLAVGLSLIIKIQEKYGSINEDEIIAINKANSDA